MLSFFEAIKYFSSDEARAASGTEYAKNHKLGPVDSKDFHHWWLRSPYDHEANYVYFIKRDGRFSYEGYITSDMIGVRPACWITLE